MRTKLLPLSETIDGRRYLKSIEEIREAAAVKLKSTALPSPRTGVLIGDVFGDMRRVAIYRTGVKVAVLEISPPDAPNEEIYSFVCEKIMAGEFDEALTKTYRQLNREKRERYLKRKAAGLTRTYERGGK